MTDPTAIPLYYDPLTQEMHGFAIHGPEFRVKYVSQIVNNLWTGGCADGLHLPNEIVHVVSLYPWEAYRYHDNVRSLLQVYMYDSLDQAMSQVDHIARWVLACMEDGPTLVHCQAGLNRSGLVAARALVLSGDFGPHEAIRLLRDRRSPAVLCNEHFEQWLLDAA